MRSPSARVLLVTGALSVSLASACSDDGGGAASTPPPSTTAPASTTSATSAPPSATAPTSSATKKRKGKRVKPIPSSPIRTVTVDGEKQSYIVQVWAEVRTDRCYDHAHGQPVVEYLTTHPCRGLARVLATTVVGSRTVVLARSALSFSGAAPGVYKIAGKFRTLVEKDGTGNLDDLFREGYRVPDGPDAVPSDLAFTALAQDSAVTVVETWYADGDTEADDPALVQLAHDLFVHL